MKLFKPSLCGRLAVFLTFTVFGLKIANVSEVVLGSLVIVIGLLVFLELCLIYRDIKAKEDDLIGPERYLNKDVVLYLHCGRKIRGFLLKIDDAVLVKNAQITESDEEGEFTARVINEHMLDEVIVRLEDISFFGKENLDKP